MSLLAIATVSFFVLMVFVSQLCFIVPENKIYIIERVGKFHKIAYPGLNFKIPFIDEIRGNLDLQILHHEVDLETKTQDNVFVDIHCSIQYKVIKNKSFEAFYSLDNPVNQLESYVFDTIRAFVPKLTLDKLFEEKETIANEVKNSLDHVMNDFGIEIIRTLITHIDPDKKVKFAMNEINAAERERIAAQHRAEAEKIVVIKAAEAQKESRILQGEGVAGQRKAIIHGLRDSLNELKNISETDPITEQEAINLLLTNQYFDTLKEIGAQSKTNAIFLNHSNYPSSFLEEEKKQNPKNNLIETIISAQLIKPNKKN